MGMCLGLCSIGEDHLKRVMADPPLIWRVIAPDDPEAYESARPRPSGMLAKLFGGKREPADLISIPEAEVDHSDLDKAWHGIHYLLTGTAFEGEGPLSFLLAGGENVGDVDVGYGPARALTPPQVREFSEALSGITPDVLRARFNPAEMKELEIYPDIWDRDPSEDDTLGYCLEYFRILQEFVSTAAQRKRGMFVYIS